MRPPSVQDCAARRALSRGGGSAQGFPASARPPKLGLLRAGLGGQGSAPTFFQGRLCGTGGAAWRRRQMRSEGFTCVGASPHFLDSTRLGRACAFPSRRAGTRLSSRCAATGASFQLQLKWRRLTSDAAAMVAFTSVGLGNDVSKKSVNASIFVSHDSRAVVAFKSASKKTLPHLNRKFLF